MKPAGGLKLALGGVGRDDRRLRFAPVVLVPEASGEEIELVTDSAGRLSCRLPAGGYRLRFEDRAETAFRVRERGWTSVRA